MFLDELPVSGTSGLQITTDFHEIRSRLNNMLWTWFDLNKDLEVASVNLLIYKKKIYLRDLSDLFERIAGKRSS